MIRPLALLIAVTLCGCRVTRPTAPVPPLPTAHRRSVSSTQAIPPAPSGLTIHPFTSVDVVANRLTPGYYLLQVSPDMIHWEDQGVFPTHEFKHTDLRVEGKRFYRVLLVPPTSATFEWEPLSMPGVTYVLKWGTNAGQVTRTQSTDKHWLTVTNLFPQTNYVVVVATKGTETSPPSDVVAYRP